MWHTALTLTLPGSHGRVSSKNDTLVIHVAGSGVVELSDRGAVTLGANDVLFVPHRVGVTYRSDETLARIEVVHITRADSEEMFHSDSDLLSAVMITSAVNALFHAHDARGGRGFTAAPAVAVALKALTSAVGTEASHFPPSRRQALPR